MLTEPAGTTCVNDEFALVRKLGQSQANTVFANHWNTWITQDDVNLMKSYGINSVRIPIGFWIIESTVNGDEFYPRFVVLVVAHSPELDPVNLFSGGLGYLRRGCAMLRAAGISVLLDLHAAPGGQVAYNSFAGRCVSQAGFWNQNNFNRMNAASAELTRLIHNEPSNFGSVWGLQALNGAFQSTALRPSGRLM